MLKRNRYWIWLQWKLVVLYLASLLMRLVVLHLASLLMLIVQFQLFYFFITSLSFLYFRVSRKEEPKKNQSQFNSTSVRKTSVQPQQSGSLVNSANLHQLVGISVHSGNTKVCAQQLGLFTDLSRDPSLKPATQIHQSGFVVYSQNPATQPPAPKSGFFVDSRKVTIQPQLTKNTTMQDRYFNQASQKLNESRNSNNTERVYNKRQPLTSVNHFLPTSPQGQKQMCKYYAQGRCYYGNKCKFSHAMRGNYNEKEGREVASWAKELVSTANFLMEWERTIVKGVKRGGLLSKGGPRWECSSYISGET